MKKLIIFCSFMVFCVNVYAIEIVKITWHADETFGYGGSVIWSVDVKNNSDVYIERVKVKFITYDPYEKIITTNYIYIHDLSPGGTYHGGGYASYFGNEYTATAQVTQVVR